MQPKPPAFLLSLSGFIALAIAMGIGRFAFTPLLPMMQNDSGLGLVEGGWLASANYLGYLAGALTAAAVPWSTPNVLRAGLMLVVATTALMGLTDNWWAWLAWRFIAGLASAWVLVSTAVLCLSRLAVLKKPQHAGVVFAGVGGGIAIAGLLCMALSLAGASSSTAWLLLGAVALVAMAGTRYLWRNPPASASAPPDSGAASSRSRHWLLIFCYATFGFGYILPATFLPAQARLLVADPAVFGLAWPLFGLAAAASTLLISRLIARYSRRTLWAASQAIMAAGVLLPALWASVTAIVFAALCVGGTFMVITMLGMQEAQAVGGKHARQLIAALTASFAAGQLAGPIFFSFTHTWFDADLNFALFLAAGGLMLGSVLVLRPARHESAATVDSTLR